MIGPYGYLSPPGPGTLKAILHRDGKKITLARNGWREDIPASDLPRWIRTMSRLADPEQNRWSGLFADYPPALARVAATLAAR